jgi:hypothetical protein
MNAAFPEVRSPRGEGMGPSGRGRIRTWMSLETGMLVGDSFTVREETAVQIHAFDATPARPDAAPQCIAFGNPCNL